MNPNPFAEVFRNAFEKDVLHSAIYLPNPHDRITSAPRVDAFLKELNRFMRVNGQAPILYQKYDFDEAKLFEYALFLRGYMRDSQNVLAHLSCEHASDPALIRLFDASSEYVVACNRQFGNRKTFDNRSEYCLWQLDFEPNTLKHCNPNVIPQAQRHNMFLFMPFRIKDNEEELQKWVFLNMQHSLDRSDVFERDVDVYVNFYPIRKSRASNVASLLKTLQNPTSYYDETDRHFVEKYWLNFVGKNIKLDEDGTVLSGEPYSEAEFKRNLSNISVFSYCSGTANAHRCLNALYDTACRFYDKQTVKDAMSGIGVMSYGFLPLQQENLYSGIHFYTNAVTDQNRLEPFVNLNNHALYERTKCTSSELPARYSVMKDGRNYVVALKMPEQSTIWKNGRPEPLNDRENGHSILFLTAPKLYDSENYANNLFSSTFEQFCLGKRGLEALNFAKRKNPTNQIMHGFLQAHSNHL